jgi:hypothetical protein
MSIAQLCSQAVVLTSQISKLRVPLVSPSGDPYIESNDDA